MKVALLHALPLDPRMWEPQREALVGQDVLAPALYGLGETMEEWARAVLELAGDDDVVLVGASMGGYCALAAARLAPERVRGVVLLGSRAEADTPERRAARAETVRRIEAGGAAALWEELGTKLVGPGASAGLVARLRSIALEQEPAGLARAVRAIGGRLDAVDVLERLGPERSLVVSGEDDALVPPGDVAAPRQVVLPDCGHLPGLERPDETNELLREALASWT